MTLTVSNLSCPDFPMPPYSAAFLIPVRRQLLDAVSECIHLFFLRPRYSSGSRPSLVNRQPLVFKGWHEQHHCSTTSRLTFTF